MTATAASRSSASPASGVSRVSRVWPGSPGGRAPARAAADVVVLLVALALAVLPVVPAFAPGAVLPALLGGLLLGAVVAVVAAVRRWSPVGTAAATVLVLVAGGGPLAAPGTTTAGVLPTASTVATVLRGVVTSWKEVLTLEPPLPVTGGVLVAPYTLAFAGSAVALGLALRGRTAARASLAAGVPALVALAALALGTRQTVLPVAAGAGAAVLALTWASWRQGLLRVDRVVSLAVGTAVVAAGGAVTGPVLAGQHPRFVLRDHVVPPFDPRDQPSPLAGLRRYVKDWKDTQLVTVRGLPAGVPVRLATMDAYDGVVWDVSGHGAADGSGAFRRPGAALAAPAGPTTDVAVEVHALPGVWLPTAGEVSGVDFAGPRAGDLAAALRVNDATGAAVLTGGLPEGLRYTLRTVVPPAPDDERIADAPAAAVVLPRPDAVPDVVPLVATELASTAGTPLEAARTLEAGLVERGYFSHGLTASGDHPSLSGHGADRMTTLLGGDLMVGDSEQYASAMALMARELGLPARVVLGFRTAEPGDAPGDLSGSASGDLSGSASGGRSDEVTFTGDDAEAWVEIAFAGHGWVPFFPTPDESKTPSEDTPVDRADPQPQVVQPPPPAPEPVTPPEEDTEQPSTREPALADDAAPVWRQVAVAAAVGLAPLLLVLSPLGAVAALRHRRRRRRRTAADAASQVAGGWDELVDTAVDLAVPVRTGGTRRETAARLSALLGSDSAAPLARLAAGADAAVFAPGQPAPAEVDAYWDGVTGMVATMHAAVGRGRRLRSRWSTASLRRGRTVRRPAGRPAALPVTPARVAPSPRRDARS